MKFWNNSNSFSFRRVLIGSCEIEIIATMARATWSFSGFNRVLWDWNQRVGRVSRPFAAVLIGSCEIEIIMPIINICEVCGVLIGSCEIEIAVDKGLILRQLVSFNRVLWDWNNKNSTSARSVCRVLIGSCEIEISTRRARVTAKRGFNLGLVRLKYCCRWNLCAERNCFNRVLWDWNPVIGNAMIPYVGVLIGSCEIEIYDLSQPSRRSPHCFNRVLWDWNLWIIFRALTTITAF